MADNRPADVDHGDGGAGRVQRISKIFIWSEVVVMSTISVGIRVKSLQRAAREFGVEGAGRQIGWR